MRILILANHYPVCSARYYADALRRLGADVRSSGVAMGRRIWGLDVPERCIWTPTYNPGDGWQPDLVIAADSDPAVLDAARDFDAPKIVVGVDNHVRDYRRPYFLQYFLAHRLVSLQPFDDNERTVHLPCAYDPVHFYASSIPWGEREYDAALVGVPYPQRVEVVRRLRAAGLRVLAVTGLLYDDYRAAYHHARISVCVSACGDVAQRIFETASLGNAVISDACPDFALLQPRGIAIARTLDDYADLARDLLANPAAAQASIDAARAWARDHTWDARARMIVVGDERGEFRAGFARDIDF